jgi:hypothetical protein
LNDAEEDQEQESLPQLGLLYRELRVRVVTIIDLLPITIIDVSRGLQRALVPVASSLLSRIVVPFPLVSRWRNGERTDDLAQTLVDHGTSFCVETQRPCPRSLAMLKVRASARIAIFTITPPVP